MESIDNRGNLCQTAQHLATAIRNNSLDMVMVVMQTPVMLLPLIFLHHLSSLYHKKMQCNALSMITWIPTEPAGTWLHDSDN